MQEHRLGYPFQSGIFRKLVSGESRFAQNREAIIIKKGRQNCRPGIYFDAFLSAIRFTTMPRATMAQPMTVGIDSRPQSRSKTMPVPV